MKIVNNFSNFANTNKSTAGTNKHIVNPQNIKENHSSKINSYKLTANSNREAAIHGKKSLDALNIKLANGVDSTSLLTVSREASKDMRPLSRIGSIYNSKGETDNSSNIKSNYSFSLLLEENA